MLQEQEVEPLGGNQVQQIDVRIIAATSRDLPAMVASGAFRADLYYRLNLLPIRLPTLRERPADLEAPVDRLLEDIARRSGLAHKTLSADALKVLARQRWPGNIRELRNALEQAALMSSIESAQVPGVKVVGLEMSAPQGTARADLEFADHAALLSYLESINAGEPQPRWVLLQAQIASTGAAGNMAAITSKWEASRRRSDDLASDRNAGVNDTVRAGRTLKSR